MTLAHDEARSVDTNNQDDLILQTVFVSRHVARKLEQMAEESAMTKEQYIRRALERSVSSQRRRA